MQHLPSVSSSKFAAMVQLSSRKNSNLRNLGPIFEGSPRSSLKNIFSTPSKNSATKIPKVNYVPWTNPFNRNQDMSESFVVNSKG